MAAATKAKEKGIGIGGVEETALERINTGIVQVGSGLVIMMVGLVGLWGVATLISAVARSGGALSMARSWLTAVTGM